MRNMNLQKVEKMTIALVSFGNFHVAWKRKDVACIERCMVEASTCPHIVTFAFLVSVLGMKYFGRQAGHI